MNPAPLDPAKTKRLLEMGMSTPFPTSQTTTKPFRKTMDQTSDGRYRYDIYLDEEVHWTLVALGAGNKMHQEDYAEQVLTEYAYVAAQRRASVTDQIEEFNKDEELG